MIRSIKIAPPNSLVALSDVTGGEPPASMDGSLIVSTPSCIVVGCLVDADGETEFIMGPAHEVDPGEQPMFDGRLSKSRIAHSVGRYFSRNACAKRSDAHSNMGKRSIGARQGYSRTIMSLLAMSRQTEKQGIKKDVERALIQAGFLKNGREKCSKKINAETEFFVYPGIGSGRTRVRSSPIAGIENLTLKTRLQSSEHADIDPRACQLLLGSLKGVRDLWGESVIYIGEGPLINRCYSTSPERARRLRLTAVEEVRQQKALD